MKHMRRAYMRGSYMRSSYRAPRSEVSAPAPANVAGVLRPRNGSLKPGASQHAGSKNQDFPQG